jgi:hypothetical protein
MRDLNKEVTPLGGKVTYEAKAVAWDLPPGGWQPKMQVDFLKHAEYHVTVEVPGKAPRSITITIDVPRPPATKPTISIFPPGAANPADILQGL